MQKSAMTNFFIGFGIKGCWVENVFSAKLFSLSPLVFSSVIAGNQRLIEWGGIFFQPSSGFLLYPGSYVLFSAAGTVLPGPCNEVNQGDWKLQMY